MLAGKRRSQPPAVANRRTADQIRVLLVDDHPIVREAIARILRDAGDIAVIGEVDNGQAAIAAVQSLQPDVALMDVNMPGMNGIQAAHAIRREASSVKIIGLSINADDTTRRAMLEAGACAYVLKSGPVEALIDTIRQCIDPA
ncbi:MAG TPA: response regulator transcription factor [Nitrococcus sp.]|nr:response regulator transcription factor [Nitrococcus sp.]